MVVVMVRGITWGMKGLGLIDLDSLKSCFDVVTEHPLESLAHDQTLARTARFIYGARPNDRFRASCWKRQD